ncbi:MAG TPA: hypothetical protein VGG48_18880 [Rhizomicrobium sp.]|jgi:hypothetical protein
MFRTIFCCAFLLTSSGVLAAEPPHTGDVAVQQVANGMRFTIITPHGFVGFDANSSWGVLAMQTKPPVTVTAFQIPDPADDGSPDATNLAVSLYQKDSPEGQDAIASTEQKYGMFTIATESHNDWTVHVRRTAQDGTIYIMLDAQAPRADMVCGVRLAWPQLDSHAEGYDGKMKTLFLAMLDSIQGKTGAYQVHPGEVVRTPDSKPASAQP